MVLFELLTTSENMDARKDSGKSLRPVRNRRYSRRSFISCHRPPKRLFTPEIKKYLKDWLVRRRQNPYPNREEKKYLAQETGLTYVQICNWFANWRRKLKNVNADRNQKTWGHLIRTYNDQAHGNVEQFSICSDDSIWSEPEPFQDSQLDIESPDCSPEREQEIEEQEVAIHTENLQLNNNYETKPNIETASSDISSPLLLSKWLESAARFQPSENNYSWWAEDRRRKPEIKQRPAVPAGRHGKDEVEAAVALTALANRIMTP